MKFLKKENGSIAPLGIGLCLLSLAAIAVSANSASMFIFQKRLLNFAEALAVEASYTSPVNNDLVSKLTPKNFERLQIEFNVLADGKTNQAIACANWQAPIDFLLAPNIQKICAHAEARQG